MSVGVTSQYGTEEREHEHVGAKMCLPAAEALRDRLQVRGDTVSEALPGMKCAQP